MNLEQLHQLRRIVYYVRYCLEETIRSLWGEVVLCEYLLAFVSDVFQELFAVEFGLLRRSLDFF